MKSTHYSTLLKAVLLILPLSLYFRSATIAQAGDRSLLAPCALRVGHLDRRAELPKGSLKVYSTTDEFNDGNVWYFPHSFYAIYTIDGTLLKNVTSQFAYDETPEVVALPVGSYMIVARSERNRSIRLPVVIKAGQRTILDLDLRETGALRRLAQN
jgi:hypothetical protein